jgi:hypothetical protein
MLRHSALLRRFFHNGPVQRRALADLEPGAEYAHLAAIHIEDGLQLGELHDAVPRAAAELDGDFSDQTRKEQRHDGS